MASEDITPRWNLPSVSFLETDAFEVQASIIDTYEQISGRTLATGDPVRLFLLSLSDIIIQLRSSVNAAARQNLLSYAKGEYLDALGQIFAVTRIPAGAAKTTLKFTLSQALVETYTIPAGTSVTDGKLIFRTDSDLLIASGALSASVSATCTEAGTSGNGASVGTIINMVEPLPYVSAAENTTQSSGGSDEEGDAALASRIRMAPNSFSVAGPSKAYAYHAMSVSSDIIDVSVHSPSAGVVNIYPLCSDGALPSNELIAEIKDYLSADDIRPLTDDVHVLSPQAVSYNIAVSYYLSESDKAVADTLKANVEKAVAEYRTWQQSHVGLDITPEYLIKLVMQAGACHVNQSTMSPASFQTLTASQVAQCGTVTVTFAGYKGY